MPEKNLPAVIQAVESRLPELKKLLPGDVSVEAFFSHFKTAAIQTPGLLDCSPRSVVIAVVRAANDGLYVDGREAVIVVRNSKRKDGTWEKVAVYQRMYQGLMKRVRAALPGCRIEARVVRANDHFEVTFGDNPSIEHAPSYKPATNNPVVAAYAIVTEASGMQHRDVMDVEEIMAIRDRSQNWKPDKPSGPWLDHFGEMAKKTVLNRLAKLLPQASGRPAIAADADDHGGADDEVEVFDATTIALPEPEEGRSPSASKTTEESEQPASVTKVGEHGEISSGRTPGNGGQAFKRHSSPAEDVNGWKVKLRDLRDRITMAEEAGKVEEVFDAWEREQAEGIPSAVLAKASELCTARLAILKEAQAYREASGE